MNFLDRFYEKFDEEKRLERRHGQVEFFVTYHYITEILKTMPNAKIADIGAGTGAYSVPLFDAGFDVTSVELAKNNIKKLRAKKRGIKTFCADARNLEMLQNNTFDLTLVFGPMYHVFDFENKLKVLREAKRITKDGGIIMVAYYLNDYAIITHGFKDGNILEAINQNKIDKDFKVISAESDIFCFDTLCNIEKYSKAVGLERVKIFAPDGPSDYMREILNKMDKKTFEIFKQYQLSRAEDKNLLGASSHIVDILKK